MAKENKALLRDDSDLMFGFKPKGKTEGKTVKKVAKKPTAKKKKK